LIAELDVVGWQNGEGYFCHLESNLVLMILNLLASSLKSQINELEWWSIAVF
jgi:hypothetical protein